VTELQRHLWRGDDATNDAYFQWKYWDGPACEHSLLLVVLHGDRVVGMRGEIGMRWEGGNPRHTFAATNSADLLIAPQHRGRGLNRELAAALAGSLTERDCPYSFGWSAGPRPLEWLPRVGWSELGSLGARISTPAAAGSRVRRALARVPVVGRHVAHRRAREFERAVEDRDPAGALHAVPDSVFRVPGGRVRLAGAPRPEAMAALVERLGHDGRVRHVRDDSWFAWRFRDPFARNRFVYWDDGQLEGYLVVQGRTNRALDHLAIVDVEAGSERVLADMVRAARDHLGVDKQVLWCATFGDDTLAVLSGNGFEPVPEPQHVGEPRAALLALRLPAADRVEKLLGSRSPMRLSDWDVRMSYSDAF
jgi:hypothetical protein